MLFSGLSVEAHYYDPTGVYAINRASTSVTVVPGPESVTSVSPASGSGLTQSFTAVYQDTRGAADFYDVGIMFSFTQYTGNETCQVVYYPSSNNLWLQNNLTDPYGGGQSLKPGSSSSVSNGLCTLSGAGSSVTKSGDTLTVTYALTFNSWLLNQQRNIYLRSEDIDDSDSSWEPLGTWTPQSQ